METDQEWLGTWNKEHKIHTVLGSEARNNKMASYCEVLLLTAKRAYYDSSTPIMSDKSYDRFESYLKALRPNSKVLEKVGI